MDLKIGDVVRLKSGSPLMTITEFGKNVFICKQKKVRDFSYQTT